MRTWGRHRRPPPQWSGGGRSHAYASRVPEPLMWVVGMLQRPRTVALALAIALSSLASAQPGLPTEAAEALREAQAAAAAALAAYDAHNPDQPLWREALAAAERARRHGLDGARLGGVPAVPLLGRHHGRQRPARRGAGRHRARLPGLLDRRPGVGRAPPDRGRRARPREPRGGGAAGAGGAGARQP